MIAYLISKGLTVCEAKVTQLVVQGLSNKEVANIIGVSEKTIKFHLTKTYRKFNIKSRTELMSRFLVLSPVVEEQRKLHTNLHDKGSNEGLN
jgi:DNA-binding CsgD family transcriptional regulator